MTVINGIDLYHCFKHGADAVKNNRKELNKINVFPVPDGDTGNNLTSTLKGIVDNIVYSTKVDDVMMSAADGALMGARGNSGIIFAQFINGLYMQMINKENLSLEEFISSINGAVPYAYHAVETPVEGTMLTIIKKWAEELKSNYGESKQGIEVLEMSLKGLEVELVHTKDQLEVLKSNNVVDSGAFGFVHFVRGVVHYFKTGEKLESSELVIEETEHVHGDTSFDKLDQRYCTEGLLEGENLDIRSIKNLLKDTGESLIVAGHNTKVRVHIHTNYPDEVFYKLRAFGTLTQQKVDDMLIQSMVHNSKRHNIGIVTDSICDLSTDLMEKHQIHMIPMNLMMDGSEYLDKLTITSPRCYDYFDDAKEFPSSSLPTAPFVESKLRYLLDIYDELIILNVSSGLSGTYNVVSKVIDSMDVRDRISHIDTRLNSAAQGLIVLKAAELLDSNMSRAEICKAIEQSLEKTKIFVYVDTLVNMVKGGRVPQVLGKFGQFINLKPIVTLDEKGNGAAFGAGLSYGQNKKKLLKLLKDQVDKGLEGYCIVHGDSRDRALDMMKACEQVTGMKPRYVTEVSPIVGISAGKGSVAIAYIGK